MGKVNTKEVRRNKSKGFIGAMLAAVIAISPLSSVGLVGAADALPDVNEKQNIDVALNWVGDSFDGDITVDLVNEAIEDKEERVVDSITITPTEFDPEADPDAKEADFVPEWIGQFTNVPVYEADAVATDKDLKPISYTLAEQSLRGYDSEIAGSFKYGLVVNYIQAGKVHVEGSVLVQYVDEDGNEIAHRTRTSGQLDSDYEVTPKTVKGYKLKDTDGAETGKYELGITSVFYIYEKEAEKEYVEGTITTKYVIEDEDGKQTEIALRESHTGEVGVDPFNIEPKDINGYTYQSTEDKVNGTYDNGINVITFLYTQDKVVEPAVIGSVVVKYIDQDGKEIADRTREAGEVGSHYDSVWLSIVGYGLVKVNGGTSGTFIEGIHIVEYVYDEVKDEANLEEGGNVIVKYTDRDGDEIAPRERLAGIDGERYNTVKKDVKGYDFLEVVGTKNGKFGEHTIVVEYVYKKSINDEDLVNPDKEDTPEAPVEDEDTPVVPEEGNDETPDIPKEDEETPEVDVTANLLTYEFALDVATNGLTVADVTAKHGDAKSTDFRGSLWIDVDGNMLMLLNSSNEKGVEVFFFDADKHELSTGDLSELYDTIENDSIKALNKRIGTDGARDMYVTTEDVSFVVWVSEDLNEVLSVSLDANNKVINKSIVTADGRMAFSVTTGNDETPDIPKEEVETPVVPEEDEEEGNDETPDIPKEEVETPVVPEEDEEVGNDETPDIPKEEVEAPVVSEEDEEEGNDETPDIPKEEVEAPVVVVDTTDKKPVVPNKDKVPVVIVDNDNDKADDDTAYLKTDTPNDKVIALDSVDADGNTVDKDGNRIDKDGKRLPNTATNTFNILAAGLGALLLAGGGLFIANRRQKNQEETE